jgi:hypothetical protein
MKKLTRFTIRLSAMAQLLVPAALAQSPVAASLARPRRLRDRAAPPRHRHHGDEPEAKTCALVWPVKPVSQSRAD